ncbi:MAG: methyltransferase domain-containing protein [Lachnospiraceae bacterium]|nr:methyltransferase domain-containing protein [Lachnospiraceae bacterium]
MNLGNGEKNLFFSKNQENKYYIENYDVNAGGKNNYVYALGEYIPEGSLVLDLCCAQGRFGPKLKEKKCRAVGIDIDRTALEMAKEKGYYEKLYCYDVTNFDAPELREIEEYYQRFDVILMSDILEHFANPTDVLVKYAKLLKEDGKILVSVPNVAHEDIIFHLIDGYFNYNDMGILDNTHLKFFTKTSFAQWIELINESDLDVYFDCEYIGGTHWQSEYIGLVMSQKEAFYDLLTEPEVGNVMQLLFELKKVKNRFEVEKLTELLKTGKSKIEKVDSYLSSNKSKIDKLNRCLEDYMESDREKEEKIGELNRCLEGYMESDREKEEKIGELNRCLEGYMESDREKEEKIGELNRCLEGYMESDREKEEKIGELNRCLEGYMESNREKEEKIGELNHCLEGYIESDRAKEEKLDELNRCLETYIANDKNKEERYRELSVSLEKSIVKEKEQVSKIIQLYEEIEHYKKSNEKANQLINEKEEKINILQTKIFKMESSFWGKISKKLRK